MQTQAETSKKRGNTQATASEHIGKQKQAQSQTHATTSEHKPHKQAKGKSTNVKHNLFKSTTMLLFKNKVDQALTKYNKIYSNQQTSNNKIVESKSKTNTIQQTP